MFGPLPILALLPLLAAQLQLARAVNLTPRNLQSVTWLQVIQAPSGAYECPYTCSYHNMQHVNGGRNLAPDNSDPKLALCGSTQGFYSGYMMAGARARQRGGAGGRGAGRPREAPACLAPPKASPSCSFHPAQALSLTAARHRAPAQCQQPASHTRLSHLFRTV